MNAAHIAEMISNWTKIENTVRENFPEATDEQVYQMTKQAMNSSLGL